MVLAGIADNGSSDFLQFGIIGANGILQLAQFIPESDNFLPDKSAGISAFGNFKRFKIAGTEHRQISAFGSIFVSIIRFLRAGTDQRRKQSIRTECTAAQN